MADHAPPSTHTTEDPKVVWVVISSYDHQLAHVDTVKNAALREAGRQEEARGHHHRAERYVLMSEQEQRFLELARDFLFARIDKGFCVGDERRWLEQARAQKRGKQ